jgi:Ca2+-transporting ATPase
MQLLMINLVTDSLPAISLGMEPVEKDVMKQKPKPKNEGLFANGMGVRVVLQGLMFGLLALGSFTIGLEFGRSAYGLKTIFEAANHEGAILYGQTAAFVTLALSQVVQAFNMRSEHSLFKIGPFTNKKLNLAALGSVLLVVLVVFVPGVKDAFSLVTLSLENYLIAFGLALVPFVVMELSKLFGFIKHK